MLYPMHLAGCRRRRATGLGLIVALAVVACGGEREGDGGAAAHTSPPAVRPSAGATAEAVGTSTDPSAITPQMVALGDSIFEGTIAGGTCFTCHGNEGKGEQLAPDLTDEQWLNGDGSLGFILNTVREGVPQPRQYPAPMPPMGGASLTDAQLLAVAAYVYARSHDGGSGEP